MRARCGRGAGIAWATLTLFVVTLACASIAEGLGRRTSLARRQVERAELTDLSRAGRALARVRVRQAGWMGPETLELAGGTVSVRRSDTSQVEMILRARISGRERREVTPAP